jgi:hypothetical protein
LSHAPSHWSYVYLLMEINLSINKMSLLCEKQVTLRGVH